MRNSPSDREWLLCINRPAVDNNETMVCIFNSVNLILITLVVIRLCEIQILFFFLCLAKLGIEILCSIILIFLCRSIV